MSEVSLFPNQMVLFKTSAAVKRTIDVNAIMNLSDKLMKPQITFDITNPKDYLFLYFYVIEVKTCSNLLFQHKPQIQYRYD